MTMIRSPLHALLLSTVVIGCGGEDDKRSAIQLAFTAEDVGEIQDNTDRLLVVMDHEEPYDATTGVSDRGAD